MTEQEAILQQIESAQTPEELLKCWYDFEVLVEHLMGGQVMGGK